MRKANKHLTLKQLESNTLGETSGGEYIAVINDVRYYYSYRLYRGSFNYICDKNAAESVVYESGIIKLDDTEYCCVELRL